LRNSERKLRPFIAGGIGASHESNSGGNPNRTLLAFHLGGGAKYELSRHFALRGDLRWLPTRANKTLPGQFDAFGNCFQQNVSNYLQRVNFTGGIAFRFLGVWGGVRGGESAEIEKSLSLTGKSRACCKALFVQTLVRQSPQAFAAFEEIANA